MMRTLIRCGALAGVVALGACSMDVQNPNDPGKERVANTPADLENFLGTQYRRWHAAFHSATGNVWGMSNVQSFENWSSLANNCMGARISIPRPANDNSIGNGCGGEQSRTYNIHSEVARGVANVLAKLDGGGFTFGTTAQDIRARAFAEFLRGLSLGYLALVYDSAGIIKASDPIGADGNPESVPLVGYQELMTEALLALTNAQAAAEDPGASGAGGFPLPSTWMFTPSSMPMTATNFTRVIRSYKARLRANVARTPAERAAVNWTEVIADATAGLTADFENITSTTTGPSNTWVNQLYAYGTWHQMTPFIVGMADTSGNYAAWIATPLADRGNTAARFIMATPDQRFPQGVTRAEQRADFNRTNATTGCSIVSPVIQFPDATVPADAYLPSSEARGSFSKCRRYYENRPSNDVTSGDSWGHSNYNHARFWTWRNVGSGGTAVNGPFPFFTRAENDLLAAEGYYRTGDYANAILMINRTRVRRGGLPALTDLDPNAPVPGGNVACVPKKPVNADNAGSGTLVCGDMLEALKWEKRIETQLTHPMAWFLDSRGWGDLVQGTGLHWAPPYQELQARGRTGAQIYSTGGPTGVAVAPVSTYGW